MKIRWSQLPGLIFVGALLAYYAATLVFWPISEHDWQLLEENVFYFLVLATATVIFAIIRRSLLKRYEDPWYPPFYLRVLPHVFWLLVVAGGVFAIEVKHVELPFFPDIEVTALQTERVQEIWFAENGTISEHYVASTGQTYLLVEIQLTSVNGAQDIEYRYTYKLQGEQTEIEAVDYPFKNFARPDRTNCNSQLYEKIPQNASVVCWVAFRIPDARVSGQIVFNNYQVFDRSPRFRF